MMPARKDTAKELDNSGGTPESERTLVLVFVALWVLHLHWPEAFGTVTGR
jgi:hypothetical protein